MKFINHHTAQIMGGLLILAALLGAVGTTLLANAELRRVENGIASACEQRSQQTDAMIEVWQRQIDVEAINPVAAPVVREGRIEAYRYGIEHHRQMPDPCDKLREYQQ